MSTYPKSRSAEADQATERNHKQCAAYGCKVRATISLGGMPFACSYHAFSPPDRFQEITRGLHDHDWLLGFIDTLMELDATHKNWRAFATEFWKDSDQFCIPAEREPAINYQNRMRAELSWRLNLVPKRPQPRIPKEPTGKRFATEIPHHYARAA